MKRSIFSFILVGVFSLSLALASCGGGKKSDDDDEPTPDDETLLQQIQGEWISNEINYAGENTRLNFSVDAFEKQHFTVEAYKYTASQTMTQLLDEGDYSISNGKLTLDFDSGDEVTGDLAISSTAMLIDEAEYHRAGGGTIKGQIRIDDGTSDPSSGTFGSASTATTQALTVSGKAAAAPKKVNYKDNLKAALRSQPTQKVIQHKHSGKTRMRLQEVTVPNDPLYDDQWGMRIINAIGGWQVADLLASDASTEVVVAVIDTGKAINDDLDGKWVDGYDFISEYVDPDTSDTIYPGGDGDGWDGNETDEGDNFYCTPGTNCGQHSWHGTHLAGIIAAARNNDKGVAGVNSPHAKILSLRVIGEGGGSIFDIAEAIRYAAGLEYGLQDDGTFLEDATDDGPRAKVINLSLGCTVVSDNPAVSPLTYNDIPEGSTGAKIIPTCNISDSDVEALLAFLDEAIQAALAEGVVVVAAAGNCNAFTAACEAPFYPADIEGVIKVGGLKNDGEFAHYLSVEGDNFIVAPSGSIEACGSVGTITQIMNTVFGAWDCRVGTSQAAAFVSGAVSLLFSLKPNLAVDEVKTILSTTALDLGPAGEDAQYGHGLLNVRDAAIQAATDNGIALDDLPAASAQFSHTELNFGETKAEKKIIVSNAGSGDVTGVSASSSSNWLTVSVGSDTTAPSVVTFTVDRDGLAAGTYDTTVAISTSAGSQDVAVSMAVSATSSTEPAGDDDDTDGDDDDDSSDFEDWLSDVEDVFGGPSYDNSVDIGSLIVLLIDKNETDASEAVVAGVETSLAINYQFDFTGVPDGDYYILAGKITPLGKICDFDNNPELACTAFPSYTNPTVLTISGDNIIDDVILGL